MMNGFVSENIISYVGCMTTILHLFLCQFGVLCAGTNGLWLLWGSLHSSAAPGHHVPQVCAPLMSGPVCWGLTGPQPTLEGCWGDPLWFQHHWPLSMSSSPLVQRCCTSSHDNRLALFGVVGGVIATSSISILISRALILSQILHVPSAEVRSRAFSTSGCTYSLLFCFVGQGIHLFSNFFSRNCGPRWICINLLHQSGSHT